MFCCVLLFAFLSVFASLFVLWRKMVALDDEILFVFMCILETDSLPYVTSHRCILHRPGCRNTEMPFTRFDLYPCPHCYCSPISSSTVRLLSFIDFSNFLHSNKQHCFCFQLLQQWFSPFCSAVPSESPPLISFRFAFRGLFKIFQPWNCLQFAST